MFYSVVCTVPLYLPVVSFSTKFHQGRYFMSCVSWKKCRKKNYNLELVIPATSKLHWIFLLCSNVWKHLDLVVQLFSKFSHKVLPLVLVLSFRVPLGFEEKLIPLTTLKEHPKVLIIFLNFFSPDLNFSYDFFQIPTGTASMMRGFGDL